MISDKWENIIWEKKITPVLLGSRKSIPRHKKTKKNLKEEGKWAWEKLKESLCDWKAEITKESGIKYACLNADENEKSKREKIKIWDANISKIRFLRKWDLEHR